MKVEFEMASLKGLKKKSNDDRFVNDYIRGIYYFAVCDGMNRDGYVASSSVIGSIKAYLNDALKNTRKFFYDEIVGNMIKYINNCAIKDIENSGFGDIGTTLDFLILDTIGNLCCFTHFGDGRIYCLRDNKLKCLTLDDKTLDDKSISVNEKDTLSDDELRLINMTKPPSVYLGDERLPDISQIISINGTKYKRIKTLFLKKDDIFLITTDGLLDCVSNREIENILCSNGLAEAVVKLQNIYIQPKEMADYYSKIKEIDKEVAIKKLRERDNMTFFVIKYTEE